MEKVAEPDSGADEYDFDENPDTSVDQHSDQIGGQAASQPVFVTQPERDSNFSEEPHLVREEAQLVSNAIEQLPLMADQAIQGEQIEPESNSGIDLGATKLSDEMSLEFISRRGTGGNGAAFRRPRCIESSEAYVGSLDKQLPEEYLRWNRWISQHAFHSSIPRGDVFLSITPKILAAIAAENDDRFRSPQETELWFAGAVRAAYLTAIGCEGRLRVLRGFDENGLPVCVAFLALSVLAAYKMQTDEEISGAAYYVRLAELLNCDIVSGLPRGFDTGVFESLWVFLQRWLVENFGTRLPMPDGDAEIRRFVALPLAHVPLRRLDVEKLPSFFVWAGYAPGAKLSFERLLAELQRWARSYASLSLSGFAALQDDRRHAVLAQVAHELETWDGALTESTGRRSASVEIMLDIVRSRPDLFYLPRRPDGFPVRFDDGAHVIEAGEDGWYTPLLLTADDGPELSSGFDWANNGNISFRRPASRVVPLAPSPDYTGFLSRPNLLRGTLCAVLCEDAIARLTGEYLSDTAGRVCEPRSHPSLPVGWKLFTNVRPDRRVDIPQGLDALDIASQVDIICSGGLRLGRRNQWLAGAPPNIIIAGLDKDEAAQIDGHNVRVGEDGVLETNGHLSDLGVHIVNAGRTRRTIEIVEPAIIHHHCPSGFDHQPHYITLPPGLWYLIGPMLGQVSHMAVNRPGSICRTEFDPAWAISVGAGPGASVVGIVSSPPAPNYIRGVKLTRGSARWASIIYSAGIRRPKFSSLLPRSDLNVMNAVWKQYFRAAQQIKRRGRGR